MDSRGAKSGLPAGRRVFNAVAALGEPHINRGKAANIFESVSFLTEGR